MRGAAPAGRGRAPGRSAASSVGFVGGLVAESAEAPARSYVAPVDCPGDGQPPEALRDPGRADGAEVEDVVEIAEPAEERAGASHRSRSRFQPRTVAGRSSAPSRGRPGLTEPPGMRAWASSSSASDLRQVPNAWPHFLASAPRFPHDARAAESLRWRPHSSAPRGEPRATLCGQAEGSGVRCPWKRLEPLHPQSVLLSPPRS